jgi:hypothetical protein
MKTKLMATLLLAGSSLFAAPRIGVGIGIGVPAAPVVVAPPIVGYASPYPGPGYVWLGGSWVFRGGPGYYGPAFRGPVYHGAYRGPVYGGHYARGYRR